MNSAKCGSRPPLTTLVEYWLGELDAAQESALEEHLFACDECHARLRQLAALGRDIRDTVRSGEIGMILTPSFVTRLQHSGLQVREYRLQPGGSVNCTIAPDDDLVIAHLHASLTGIERLDLVGIDETAGRNWRVEDIAFATDTGDVAVATDTAALRRLTYATLRMELRAVEGAQERLVASYTFNHSPYGSAA